jgi:hypothetical protein
MHQILLVLVAMVACVLTAEVQDQEAAEQYFRIHGFYPSWYQYGAFAGVRSFSGYPYTYGAYPTYAGVKSFYGAYPAGYVAPANTYRTYSGFGYAY